MSKVAEIITERILEQLEAGTVPWKKGWKGAGRPKNLLTGKAYRGTNIWLLSGSEYWATAKQVKQLGGSVKPDELSNPSIGVFFKPIFEENEDTGERVVKRRILLYFKIFALHQLDVPEKVLNKIHDGESVLDFSPIESAEKIVREMPNRPEIKHSSQDSAHYSIIFDHVHMPNKELFDSELRYYEVLFHELAHSTGAEKRLNRQLKGNTAGNRESYSKEELIAEMASAMLCGEAGIDEASTIENSASYIENWMKALKKDSTLLVSAAQNAQKAVDYILQTTFDN